VISRKPQPGSGTSTAPDDAGSSGTPTETILFDLDGTLVDSAQDLADSGNALLRSYGAPVLTSAEVVAMVGDGARELVRRLLVARNVGVPLNHALARFVALYDARLVATTRPYEGVVEMLQDASTRAPTDAELSAYLVANQARFVQPAIVSFEQVFIGEATSGRRVAYAAAVTREALRKGADAEELGRATLLPHRMARTPADLVARDFGASFAAALEKVPVGEWVGPIDSSFGAHYVRVSHRTPAVAPQLAAVRDHVVREWENERRQRARNDAYTKMRAEYQVSIEAELTTERR